MNNIGHPAPEDLALYAIGTVDEPVADETASQIEVHLGVCLECRMAVLMHMELRDIEALGLLPAAEETPVSHPLRRGAKVEREREHTRGIKGILGAIGGLSGVFGMAHSLGEHTSPALGSDHSGISEATNHEEPGCDARGNISHNKFSVDIVRDTSHPTSEVIKSGQSHFESDTAHGKVTPAMLTLSASDTFADSKKTFGEHAIHGTSELVHQQYADTCAVQCQHLILNQFGVDVSEDQLIKEAEARGIYSPGHGTALEDVGKLLETHGIPVHRDMNANVFNLAVELSQGHKVIVGLDSGELWHTHTILESIAEAFGVTGADHAVIVSGIDTSDPNHPHVIVTDPGTGDIARSYPLTDFLDAWKGSHFSMISTTMPAPAAFNPEMVNFDYHAGHIPSVGAAPYELVHQMAESAASDPDPDVLHKMTDIFHHIADGDLPVNSLLGHLALEDPAHHSLADLASYLLSITQGAFSTGAMASLIESFSDVGMIHHESTDTDRHILQPHHESHHYADPFGSDTDHDPDTSADDDDS